ncbi:MAG: hypothetical protein JSW73_03640 [Candidatus Woesearchaeota archaeon]|nr:MAG: hypothetical protein JSW73_03640 [Candidatus Woesearchaeota archaeon]
MKLEIEVIKMTVSEKQVEKYIELETKKNKIGARYQDIVKVFVHEPNDELTLEELLMRLESEGAIQLGAIKRYDRSCDCSTCSPIIDYIYWPIPQLWQSINVKH